jgi:cytochrome bd ubiquinol oxidase subunit I
MSALLLARIQFGLTIGFHFLFPPISIGLAWWVVALEAAARRGREREWEDLARFFGRLFALTFGAGVATGVVMSFQFGTAWSGFVRTVSDVFGGFLVAEVLTSFFVESVFLGIWLFGRERTPAWLHRLSMIIVAAAATLSGFWILAANSWMQTPAGYVVADGRIGLASFAAALFNPSLFEHVLHTLNASLLTGSFLVAGSSAYLLLKGRAGAKVRRLLAAAVIAGLASALIEVVPSGHLQAVEVGRRQPAKLATIEGVYETSGRVPFLLFGIPTAEPPYVRNRIEIPGALSFLFEFDADYVVTGLKDIPVDERPPRVVTFVSFHLMVYLGVLFILVTGMAVLLLLLKRLHGCRWMLRLLVVAMPLPLACLELGWITAEVGRQPWIVYGLLRTRSAVSASVTGGELLFSLIAFSLAYLAVGAAYVTLFARGIRRGPGIDAAGETY